MLSVTSFAPIAAAGAVLSIAAAFGHLTPWSLFSAISLSVVTWVCATFGDLRDMRAPIIFLLAYYPPYVIAEGDLPSGIVFLIFGHTLLAWGFYAVSERWYGDIVGYTWAVMALIGIAAVIGVIPSQPGQGIAWNYWHLLACTNHLQNLIIGVGVYARHRELA